MKTKKRPKKIDEEKKREIISKLDSNQKTSMSIAHKDR